ncbi:TonB-dependent receptor [Pseudomonadales bacterium]|nr:TonB-dependent receptor [Gammaproteobacteria bacterium]MDA7725662.1 TonB-dependent receptor [Pseudomonadales bacterium]MDA7772352.1 TonB-dependent receptor [Pseudomonadales bacterium]MDB2449371.1 TonB-dependent receptor [Pseudomonadales bacterium]MDC0939087.1 TonB-dependent receptor [Pseudomonadales bacterium]
MRGNQEDQQGTCIASTPENDLKDRRGRLGGLIGGLLGALPYVALTLGSAAVSTTVSADSVLEEVIVTARKRSESIQDVPVSVTAIGQELKESSVRRLEDIQNFAPNLYIRRTPGIASGAAISIRGVSASESDKSFDPAIGVVMDGMFLGTSSGVLLQNFDIKRIEVLRGPQGTLFGKNTTGGLINVIRGDVTMEFGADIDLTAGQNGRQDIKAVVNLPVIDDKLGVKLFAANIQSDGFVWNSTLDEDVGGDDIQNYGFTALWNATDTFNLKFHYEKFKDQSDQGAYTNVNQAGELTCVFGGCQSTSADGPDQNSANGRNDSDNEYDTFIATANLDLESFLLTYIGSSRDMDENNMQHFDGAPVDLLRMRFFNDWKQTSHELRMTSQFSDRVEFVAGVYHWDVDYVQRWDVGDLHHQLSNIGVIPVPLSPTVLSSNGQSQESTSKAVFFSGDLHLNDQWTVTAGLRWTEETKDFIGGNGGAFYDPALGEPIPGLVDPQPFNGKWSEVTPKIGFQYQHDEDIMVFGSYSEGFKSGGFFGRQANFDINPTYEPEYVESFEVGMKSTLLDGRMIFNPTVFLSQYKDKQESILIPINLSNVATVVRNAAVLDMWGVELEAQYQITDAWYLRATYGYINAEFDSYLADINGDQTITDNSDLRTRNTPENTFGLTTTYTIPVGNGDLKALLSYRWRDEVEMIANNDALGHLDSLDDLSATLTYSWDDERYRVTAFGRNMTDQREQKVGRIGGLTSRGWWNEGATYGVEFSFSI